MKEYKYEQRTLGNILADKSQTIGEKVFLLYENVKVTYQEMEKNSNKIANSFLNIGIHKGDKVCIVMENSIEFLYTWFALGKIGAIMVPINPAFKGSLLKYIINSSDASVMIVDGNLIDRIVFIQNEIEKVKTIIILHDYSDENSGLSLNFTLKKFKDLYGGSTETPASNVQFFDPMTILYTSGTTGPSKGAILSHAHYYFIAYQVNRYMRYDENSVIYSCLPLFHANASMLGAFGAMLSEGIFAMAKKFSLSTFWDEIRSYNATHTGVVGSIFSLLWKQPLKENDADNPLKVMKVSPWSSEFEEFEKRFDIKLITAYGTTETGIVCVSPFYEKIRPGSCGKPLNAYDARIFGDYDIELDPKFTGEIVVRGKEPYSQMDSYYNMPEATVQAFKNLWYHTGDFGYVDEDGYFYFVDRKKDAIRRRGENISSYEVEEIINSHPKVLHSGVVGVPSELTEDDVCAFVVLKKGQNLTPEELISFCEDRMAYFAVPRYINFRKSLPKTPTSRIEKYKLREQGVTKSTWDRERAGYKLKR